MRNIDKIKQMNIDEMAKWIKEYISCDFCNAILNRRNTCCEDFCDTREQKIKHWLKNEAEE